MYREDQDEEENRREGKNKKKSRHEKDTLHWGREKEKETEKEKQLNDAKKFRWIFLLGQRGQKGLILGERPDGNGLFHWPVDRNRLEGTGITKFLVEPDHSDRRLVNSTVGDRRSARSYPLLSFVFSCLLLAFPFPFLLNILFFLSFFFLFSFICFNF